MKKYHDIKTDKGYSETWHGIIRGEVIAFGHTLPIDCRVFSLLDDGSCGFYGLIQGAYNTMHDPGFLNRKLSMETSHPLFIPRLVGLSQLYVEDGLKCPMTRLMMCKFMLNKCDERPGCYSDLWSYHPEAKALKYGREIASLSNINIPSGTLYKGQEWALSLLHANTQLDEGYIRVFADYLDGAVAFSVLEKRFRYSTDRRVTRSTGPTESFSVTEWIEFVHQDVNDIQSSFSQVPLAVWLLHLVMKPYGNDPRNTKNHLSCYPASGSLTQKRICHR
jgi:hypothetical protein